jgi:hypothetical protein
MTLNEWTAAWENLVYQFSNGLLTSMQYKTAHDALFAQRPTSDDEADPHPQV